jgi:anti-anti-sigma factor
MELSYEVNGGVLSVSMKHAINLYNADIVKKELLKIIEINESKDLALLLSDTPYLDSSGIAALNQVQKKIHSLGQSMYLVQVNPNILGALSLSGMIGIFKIVDSIHKINAE